ncbi:MAG: tRNA lysidine(34) synthetase TilS [Pyrinomonadaceae bacterium]
MKDFVRKFVTEWRRFEIAAETSVVAAVSGGADSMAMLGALGELKAAGKIRNRFVVANFDHGIRGSESAIEQDFVRDFSAKLGFEFRGGVAPPGSIDGNIEQSARNARYAFLLRVSVDTASQIVLTAHTMNDQAETVLMNLIRGSGIEGLSGMHLRRKMSGSPDVELLRPLVRWAERNDCEQMCSDAGIQYFDDPMNEDPAFTRVRIRRELLPLLSTFNPEIVRGLAETAFRLESQARVLKDIGELDGLNSLVSDSRLSISALLEIPDHLRVLVLRIWLEKQIGTRRRLGSVHINSVLCLAKSDKSGRLAELPGGIHILKSSGFLKVKRALVD